MGIPKEKYGLYIRPIPGTKNVEVDLDAVADSLRAKPVEKIIQERKPPKKTTVSSRIKELVTQGLTNPQIWDIVKPEFGLTDKQRHYPAWYRSAMKREGAKSQ
jgi:hypothetical protein